MKAVIITKNLILAIIMLITFYMAVILIRDKSINEDILEVMENYFPYLLAGYVFMKMVQEVGSVKRREEKQ